MEETTCCFFGHRKVDISEELRNKLVQLIENLIVEEKVDTFLFGSKSEFNRLCYQVVSELKNDYPDIRRFYVSVYPPYNGDAESPLRGYEEACYPEHIRRAGKATYVERNYTMIDQSKFCVVYFDENYMPPKRKRQSIYLPEIQPKSGTKVALEYAQKRCKKMINLFDKNNV